MPVPSPARAGLEAECAGWRVTSRQEKPVSVGLPFDGLRSSGFLPCAGLSRLIYHVERCKESGYSGRENALEVLQEMGEENARLKASQFRS